MTIHLIKLCVGAESLDDLRQWQAKRLAEAKRAGKKPELVHITRHMPRRAGEVLNGGSLYWVIGGVITARQKLVELRAVEKNGIAHCALVYEKELIRVAPRAHRPFQGWRYFDPKSAPPDLDKRAEQLPEEMLRELTGAGLI